MRVERDGKVARIVIDSPANRNALGGPVLAGLASALRETLALPEVRVVVLTGEGTTFSSGADLYDTTDSAVLEQSYRDVFECILDADKPVVARVNGHCLGIAIGLVAVCDLSVAVEDGVFGFTEVRIGRTATLATVVSLPRLRLADAADLLLRANRFDGTRAAEVGLVTKSVARDKLDAEIDVFVGDLLAGAPTALANTKRLIRQLPRLDAAEAWDLAFRMTRETSGSPEAEEGTAAFRERRDPLWPTPELGRAGQW